MSNARADRKFTEMGDAVRDRHERSNGASASRTGGADAGFPDLDSTHIALEAGGVGVWSWDVKSNVVQWSPNLEHIHGLVAGDFQGKFSGFQKDIHPEDQPEVMAAIQESLRTGKPYHAHYRLAPRADEEDRWIEAIATVVQEDGAPVRLLGICRDVTDRQKLLRELRVRAKQQEIVARLGERALIEGDLQKLFDETAAAIADILDVEFVKILELVPGDAELLLRAGVGWSPGLVGTAHESTGRHSQAGYALASGGTRDRHRPQIGDTVRGAGTAARSRRQQRRQRADRGARRARLRRGRRTDTARRRRFGEPDVAFLTAITNLLAGAIHRRQSDQRHELMIRELRHRSGNLFAQLLALFSQTARNSRSVADLVTKYQSRVLALAERPSPDHRGRLALDVARRSAARAARALSRSRDARRPGCVSRAGPVLRAQLCRARAGHQCRKVRQSVQPGRPAGGELDGQPRRAGIDARARLDGARRAAAEARTPHRLRIAADRHGDRAPARRRNPPRVQSGRAWTRVLSSRSRTSAGRSAPRRSCPTATRSSSRMAVSRSSTDTARMGQHGASGRAREPCDQRDKFRLPPGSRLFEHRLEMPAQGLIGDPFSHRDLGQ